MRVAVVGAPEESCTAVLSAQGVAPRDRSRGHQGVVVDGGIVHDVGPSRTPRHGVGVDPVRLRRNCARCALSHVRSGRIVAMLALPLLLQHRSARVLPRPLQVCTAGARAVSSLALCPPQFTSIQPATSLQAVEQASAMGSRAQACSTIPQHRHRQQRQPQSCLSNCSRCTRAVSRRARGSAGLCGGMGAWMVSENWVLSVVWKNPPPRDHEGRSWGCSRL